MKSFKQYIREAGLSPYQSNPNDRTVYDKEGLSNIINDGGREHGGIEKYLTKKTDSLGNAQDHLDDHPPNSNMPSRLIHPDTFDNPPNNMPITKYGNHNTPPPITQGQGFRGIRPAAPEPDNELKPGQPHPDEEK